MRPLCEALWKAAQGEAKDFYHGLVQVAAAFYHYEKGNLHGSRTLLGKGLAHLRPFPDAYLGIDLERLRRDLRPWGDHFEGGRRPSDFPRLTMRSAPKEEGSSGGVTGLRWRG